MIPDIKETNLPNYATLSAAKVNLQDMGEWTIEAEVSIDGGITPDFSKDWEIEWRGEKFVMPLRKPQASKENTSLNSKFTLTFRHWAQRELGRYYFTTVQPTESGTAVADKYIATVSLNLGDFCVLLGEVLAMHWDSITVDLNPAYVYDKSPQTVEISYSKIWDVLQQVYEVYGVRWRIEAVSGGGYAVRIGYDAAELGHVFEYGFEGGLLKLERQVQDDEICNLLLGRGGEKNLPLRYFKDIDPNNPDFRADPDWIPELSAIYFDRLRGKTFREYVRGWKTNPRRQLTDSEGDPIIDQTTGEPIAVEEYDPVEGSTEWAYLKGHTDTKFDPVEYVKDDASIARYGELWGGLEDNEDIYPTIQGVTIDPYGRIDETVDIEQVTSDNVQESTGADAVLYDIEGGESVRKTVKLSAGERQKVKLYGVPFTVPALKTANLVLDMGILSDIANAELVEYSVSVLPLGGGTAREPSAIPAGQWKFEIDATVRSLRTQGDENVTVGLSGCKLMVADGDSMKWSGTFDIWIKNVFQTAKKAGESDVQYAERVWLPVLGDRTGDEAKVMFSDGLLAGEDYEFVITKYPVYDTSKTLTDDEGNTYTSHWRLTLAKSEADYETTGQYLPSTYRQGKAGDHFFFIGTEMTHDYTLWAEQRLDEYKTDELGKKSEIQPTWSVGLDKVRIAGGGASDALINSLEAGASVRLANKQLVEGAYETLYIQTISFDYKSDSIVPDVDVTLADKPSAAGSSVSTLSGEVSALQRQVGSLSAIESVVRAVGDRLYLRKDGFSDRSLSPTEFGSLLTSLSFRSGIVGGEGWGFFRDASGSWVLETDRINVRKEMEVNTLVINQITARGGMIVESAASLQIERVTQTTAGYVCIFDQKNGSVANLFQVGDVAYCSRFTPENAALKYYRRRVVEVAEDSVTLSATVADGSGVPSAGDVIVQYGSYTDASRRFVIVRDVKDGGYERFLEGLDSVTASGTEYFFVGRQAGMYNGRPRWYVGDEKGYIEWKDGKLSILGELSVNSTVGDTPIDKFVTEAASDTLMPYIDALQQQVDGVVESWSFAYSPTADNYPASEWKTDAEKKAHVGDVFFNIQPYENEDGSTNKDAGKAWRWSPTDTEHSGYHWHEIADSDAVKALQLAQLSVTDTDVLYIQASSNTVAPALPIVNQTTGRIEDWNGWSSDAPTWKAGMYIWQTTYVLRGSGDYSFNPDPATCISGKNGADGAAGADGSSYEPNLIKGGGEKMTSSTYMLGSCPWDNRPAAGTQCTLTVCGKCGAKDTAIVLFQNEGYTQIKGDLTSKTEVVQSYPFTVADSASAKKTDIAFFHYPNDSDFDPDTYIKWAVVTLGDTVVKAWVPAASEMEGTAGVGIERIAEEYYLSDSADEPVGGEWSETRPDWVAGKYYWTRSHIYYTDGTDETVGEICVTGDIQPGGVNLLRNSGAERTLTRQTNYALDENLSTNTYYVLTVWGEPENDELSFSAAYYWNGGVNSLGTLTKVRDGVYQTIFRRSVFVSGSGLQTFFIRILQTPTSAINNGSTIHRVKLERGNIGTDWSPSPHDFDYLTSALKENTTVRGGLIQTSMVSLGQTINGVYTVKSGSNGIGSEEKPGGGIAFWAGGECYDLTDTSLTDTQKGVAAQYVIRMDGTGYFSGGAIEVEPDKIVVGGNVILDSEGLKLSIAGAGNTLLVADTSIGDEDASVTFDTVGITWSPSLSIWTPTSASGALQSSFIAAEVSRTQSLYGAKTIPAGSDITVNVSVSFAFTNGDSSGIIGSFIAEVLNASGTAVASSSQILQGSGGTWTAQCRINFKTTAAGVYRVRVRLPKGATASGGSTQTTTASVSGSAQTQFGAANQTLLGNDGFITSWDGSMLYANPKMVVMQHGAYGFKIDDDGFWVKVGGQWEAWKP